MARELENPQLATLDIDLDSELYSKILEVAERHNIDVDTAVSKLLIAGMLTEAASLAGYDVKGKMSDGTEVIIMKAR